MKRTQLRNVFLLACVVLLIVPSCHKGPKITPEVKNAIINISAPKARVFEATSIALISRGFVIITANDSLGLLTTEFKKAEESFKESFLQGVFGEKQHPEVQFVTSIIEKAGNSTLTIMAKGRIIYKKRYYADYIFSDEFMNLVRKIGEEIKAQSEIK